jgi:serine/threonine protein kinase
MNAPNDPASTSSKATIGFAPPPAVADEHATGERFGDFVLLEELGRGGMGVVYKAFEPQLGRHVAVKMILSGSLCDSVEIQRFHSEASAAARLRHPNIVKVLRVGSQDGRHYFSMDFIDGKSLAQCLADGPLPGRTAARYLVTVAHAIHHAHEQGILHRDIKPANILIDADDKPHVTDFGLAKQLSGDKGQTRTGALLGTPSYMAPEQARGERDLKPATDVYGLGALLYELVTARPPFRGETPVDTVIQVMENDPAPPRLLNPKIDLDLETITLKCLAKSPIDRYPSAKALAEDLERYLAGESIEARSLNMFDYLGRTLQRSQFDIEFRSYGNLILIFAAIIGVMHVAKFFLMINKEPYPLIFSARIAQFVLLFTAFWRFKPQGRGLMPATSPERLLWSVWLGYIVASLLAGEAMRELSGREALYRGDVYVFYALFTGMAFFILGSSFWGGMYAVGAAFFALSFVMLARVQWAVLEFGLLWSLSLSVIGLRLRGLGQERAKSVP